MSALAELSPLKQTYAQARENFEHIVGHLDSKETSGMTLSELERELEKKGRELMRIQDLREQTRKAAEARTHKMGTRLSKGEKKNAKRMATVAAVYTITPFVRTPEDLVGDGGSPRQNCFLGRRKRVAPK